MIEAAAAFVAWLGVSLVVLSDGRRGLALGTLLAAAGLAGVALPEAGPAGAIALVAGGAAAAARRFTAGPGKWGIMPPGSTPRLVLCVAGGLLALWVGLAVMTGEGAGLRFAVMSVAGLAGARALSSADTSVAQTAFAVLALAVATGAALAADAGVWPFLAGAGVAAAVTWAPGRVLRAA